MRHEHGQLRREQTARNFQDWRELARKLRNLQAAKKHDIERSVACVRRITESVDADDELRFAAYNCFFGVQIFSRRAQGKTEMSGQHIAKTSAAEHVHLRLTPRSSGHRSLHSRLCPTGRLA